MVDLIAIHSFIHKSSLLSYEYWYGSEERVRKIEIYLSMCAVMTKRKWFHWFVTYILGTAELEIKQISFDNLIIHDIPY